MSIRDLKTIEERRNFIKKKLQVNLEAIGYYPSQLEKAQYTNCENMIGAISIPIGVAGPIYINGEFVKGEHFIPLATTEGALVASVNRGCKAISQSGEAVARVEDVGATRGPVFETSGIIEGQKFKTFLASHIADLQNTAAQTSKHLMLKKLDVNIAGKYVYVRFYFNTAEAMGMNMATIATQKIVKFIYAKTKIRCISIAGNFDTDKKPAGINFILGRGKKVWAEAKISRDVIVETLKTSAEKIHEVWIAKCMVGSAMSGAIGSNSHFANILSAIFIATGQDVAHVVEGSMGITSTHLSGDDLYISIYMPDLMTGVIGGGTGLPSQREALEIMGIKKEKGDNLKFAEICASAVLAGELSLLASLAQGSLASAHERFARGK